MNRRLLLPTIALTGLVLAGCGSSVKTIDELPANPNNPVPTAEATPTPSETPTPEPVPVDELGGEEVEEGSTLGEGPSQEALEAEVPDTFEATVKVGQAAVIPGLGADNFAEVVITEGENLVGVDIPTDVEIVYPNGEPVNGGVLVYVTAPGVVEGKVVEVGVTGTDIKPTGGGVAFTLTVEEA